MLPAVPGVIGSRPDITGFPTAPSRQGSQSNMDVYVEALAPIARDLPGLHSLDVDLGYRHSSYQHGGSADSYKAELLYRPAQTVLLRGSYEHAVRAPSIDELFYPQLTNQFEIPIPDPCSYKDGARVATRTRRKSRPFAWHKACRPHCCPDTCSTCGASTAFPEATRTCNPKRQTPIRSARSSPRPSKAPRSGNCRYQSTGTTSNSRMRSAAGNPSPPWNAASTTPTTRTSMQATSIAVSSRAARQPARSSRKILDSNIGGIETSGVDLQVDWAMDLGAGQLGANLYVTHVQDWKYSDPSGGTIEYAGTIGGGGITRALPEWKSLLNLSYQRGAFGTYARWRYMDSMTDALYPDFRVPHRNYLDLGGERGRRLQESCMDPRPASGVDNATDTDPPLFPSYSQANTDPSAYEVLGRRYYVSLGYRF